MTEQASTGSAQPPSPRAATGGFFGWTRDRAFLEQAGQELLIAVGIDEPRARELPRLVRLAEQMDAFQTAVDASHGATEGSSVAVDDYSPEERQQLNDLLGEIASIALPVADQGIQLLAERGIRLELAALDGSATRMALREIEMIYNSGQWRDLSGTALDDYFALFADRHSACRTVPVKPTRREIRAIVAVLRCMPPTTVRRMVKLRGRLFLSVMVRFLLRGVRHAEAADART